MKRLLLAGLCVLPFMRARANQYDAYGSLIGMASAALSDKGPEAGDIAPDGSSAAKRGSPRASTGEQESKFGPAHAEKQGNNPEKKTPASGAKYEAAKDDAKPPVSVPASAAPRVWTRLFSSLLPAMKSASSFEVSASTSLRVRPRPVPQTTAASAAGGARGLLEFVAAATAPAVR